MIYPVVLCPTLCFDYRVAGLHEGEVPAFHRALYLGAGGLGVCQTLDLLQVPNQALLCSGGPYAPLLEQLLEQQNLHYRTLEANDPIELHTTLHAAQGEVTRVVSPAPGDSAQGQMAQLLQDLLREGDCVVLCGPLGNRYTTRSYEHLAMTARSCGAHVVLNIPAVQLGAALAHEPLIACLPLGQLWELADAHLTAPEEIISFCRGLNRLKTPTVLITMGEKGTLCVSGGKALLAQSPAPVHRLAEGADDALLAGYLWGAAQALPNDVCLKMGAACAAARAALSPDQPLSKGAVLRTLDEIRITELKAES